ncbi:MAG: DUF3782 domain-containing protein [Candidatus Korarchaeota archaeon]|nr:DUF3782 domain-containing protein [Candidatus Korarchaeota archaeon]
MQSLKEEILELLEKDREFRLAVASLIGYKEILEKLEEHDRKFNEVIEEIRGIKEKLVEHDRKFNEVIERLEEHDRKFNEVIGRLEEHDRKFNEVIGRIEKLEERFEQLSMRVEVTIGSMGRRWGSDLERMVLEIFREALERRGIEPGEVKKFRFKDEDGSVTGVRGRVVDVDILVEDFRFYVIEVKSRAELDHVEYLMEKVKLVEKIMDRKVDKAMIVAVNVDKEAYERARELGIDVICGHVIE